MTGTQLMVDEWLKQAAAFGSRLGAGALIFLCLLLAGCGSNESPPSAPSTPLATSASSAPFPEPPAVIVAETPPSIFSEARVLPLTLEITSANLHALRDQPRDWVRAILRTPDQVYEDVAVHIKGSQGSLQTIDERPSLTVSFTRFNGTKRFHGLRKIHLNNCAEDPSAMTQILCGELCRQAGLPAARSCHATLTLNDRNLGLYVLTEGLTRDFLAQDFTRTGGNLYDGGFRRDIDRRLERIGGDGPDNQADRLALLAAAREPDPQRRWERLQTVLDIDRFISLLAITALTWNWDGYPMARNNYRIYRDPESKRMIFIPHGLDQMFWEPQGTIYPRMRGLVAAAVMDTPEGRAQYKARLAEVHRDIFQVPVLHRRIDELTSLIQPYHSNASLQGARLKKLIAGRSRSVARQLEVIEIE